MDATPDPTALFADVDQILTDASDQITEEAREATIDNVMQFFKLTRRQARVVLIGTDQSIRAAAAIHGQPVEEFFPRLSESARLAMLAFTAGAVHQHDIDHGIDPETGEPL